MEERFEYYWRVYTLAFQLGMKLAVRCEGFQHIIAISAPGCNITYSPFIWLDDRGQVCTVSLVRISKDIKISLGARVRLLTLSAFKGPLKLDSRPSELMLFISTPCLLKASQNGLS